MFDVQFLGTEVVNVFQDGDYRKFVCNSRALVNGQIVTETGYGASLEEAKAKTSSNLNRLLANLKKDAEQRCFNNSSKSVSAFQVSKSKDSLNGGGNKKATERQLELLSKLAEEQYQSIEDLIQRTFKKRMDELFGAEANILIRQLKRNDK